MKKFVSGLLIGLLISTSIFAFANDEIVARFANFNFLVNGQDVQLQTKPLNVNGTSYLPVRELANILGYDVTYKADTMTIELNNQETTNANNENPALPTVSEKTIVINEEIELSGITVTINKIDYTQEYNNATLQAGYYTFIDYSVNVSEYASKESHSGLRIKLSSENQINMPSAFMNITSSLVGETIDKYDIVRGRNYYFADYLIVEYLGEEVKIEISN